MARNNKDKRSVCRNLMVEFEREENAQENFKTKSEEEQRQSAYIENEKLLGTDLNSKIRKWNFDFVKETPLEGDWDWDFEQDENDERQRENSQNDDNNCKSGDGKSFTINLC